MLHFEALWHNKYHISDREAPNSQLFGPLNVNYTTSMSIFMLFPAPNTVYIYSVMIRWKQIMVLTFTFSESIPNISVEAVTSVGTLHLRAPSLWVTVVGALQTLIKLCNIRMRLSWQPYWKQKRRLETNENDEVTFKDIQMRLSWKHDASECVHKDDVI